MKLGEDHLVFIIVVILAVAIFLSLNFKFYKPPEQKRVALEKIDFHEHYIANGSVDNFLTAAEKLNIAKTVLLPTGKAPDNSGHRENVAGALELRKEFPDKFVVFCVIDESDENSTEEIKECYQNGGRGIKLLGGLPDYYDEPWNSKKLYRVYNLAAELKLPILIHIEGRVKNQTIPMEQAVRDFPNVTFVFAHYCREYLPVPRFNFCSRILDNHNNTYVDISIGNPFPVYMEIVSNYTSNFTDYVLIYQNRLVWGSDIFIGGKSARSEQYYVERIGCDLDVLEKESYFCRFSISRKKLRGMNLPLEVLEKIYLKNPKKILGLNN